ncbi:hypothetical protein BOTU111921_15775 [Bordetella tumbae]|uniref:hypothetical protein n=1 Tax=Bordetella tumbae TaxID=1649139 RepID=UPI0039EEBEE6
MQLSNILNSIMTAFWSDTSEPSNEEPSSLYGDHMTSDTHGADIATESSGDEPILPTNAVNALVQAAIHTEDAAHQALAGHENAQANAGALLVAATNPDVPAVHQALAGHENAQANFGALLAAAANPGVLAVHPALFPTPENARAG